MQSNQHVKEQGYFLRAPVMATTVAEQLKNPKSLLAIEVQNAIVNRDVLLRQLKIKEFQYATALQMQREAEDAENQEAAERREEKQNAMLRQSLKEYYAEQHKIAEQAVMMGEKPLNAYDRLMAAVADHQLQINLITARLQTVNQQIQMTQTGFAEAAASWKTARHSYVDSYFDSVYQTPFKTPLSLYLGDQEFSVFSMDLDGTYGTHLSPKQRAMIEEHRRESKERASNVLPPLEALDRLQKMDSQHIALQQPNKERVALNMHEFKQSIHDIVPVKDELQMWVDAFPAEQHVMIMSEFVRMHRSILRFATTLVMETQGNSVLIQQRLRQMKEAHEAMVFELRMKEKLLAEKRELEASKNQKEMAMQQILGDVVVICIQNGQHQKANLISKVAQATQEKSTLDKAEIDVLPSAEAEVVRSSIQMGRSAAPAA